MDLIIILALIILIVIFVRDHKTVIYFIGITEIFFRILHFFGDHLTIAPVVNRFINNNIPASLFNILAKYSNGLLFDILMWLLFGCFVLLEFYLIKYFFKKKK